MLKQTAYAALPDEGDGAELQRSPRKMRNDTAASGEFRINLPPDVLAEMRRNAASPRTAMQVDGFRPGIFGRLLDLVTGRRR
jgi:hypothetical protein